jgi:hypothetical protein
VSLWNYIFPKKPDYPILITRDESIFIREWLEGILGDHEGQMNPNEVDMMYSICFKLQRQEAQIAEK